MRFVYIGIGTLVVVIAIIAVGGWMLPARHSASVARTYKASPRALFGLITDVGSFPVWRREVAGVEVLPDDNGRARWREKTKNGPPITYVVERSVPDELLVGRIADTNLPFGGAWTYELTPAGDGATTLRITEDGEVYNPIFRFVSRFVMGHDATIKQYLSAVGTRFPEVAENAAGR
ncbi:MAG TPA: SRPBCC family protein [Gemmatimonadaceae bacterium]|jgi:uncharacterized protein YndB with AHSA1/START domain